MERKYKDMSNKVHQIDERFTHLLPAGCVEITNAEATALLYTAPTPEQLAAQRIVRAKEELVVSDVVAIRCMKANVLFPLEWKTYVTTLRDIVNGVGTTIPSRPSYPEGT